MELILIEKKREIRQISYNLKNYKTAILYNNKNKNKNKNRRNCTNARGFLVID